MTKKFICVQGSPEIPKGAIALPIEGFANYDIQVNECIIPGLNLSAGQIEGNSCWEEVKEEPAGKWKPDKYEGYHYVNDFSCASMGIWTEHAADEGRLRIGNVYRTREEAEDEVKRRESIAKAWWPEDGKECYVWASDEFSDDKQASCEIYDNRLAADAYIGACHKTKEACEEWGRTYAHLFTKKSHD